MNESFLKEKSQFLNALKLFNEHYFWECHEELEQLWLEEPQSLRYLYWAILQAATSLYHYQNENMSGAVGQISKSAEKIYHFESAPAFSHQLFTQSIEMSHWNDFKDLVEGHSFDSLLEFRFSI